VGFNVSKVGPYKGMLENREGLLLLELSIVVAIILIIVAISVPNLLQSRMLVREASVMADLDTLNHELEAYWMTCATYPKSLSELESNTGGCLAHSSGETPMSRASASQCLGCGTYRPARMSDA